MRVDNILISNGSIFMGLITNNQYYCLIKSICVYSLFIMTKSISHLISQTPCISHV